MDEVDPKVRGTARQDDENHTPAGSSSIALSGEKGNIEGVADLLG